MTKCHVQHSFAPAPPFWIRQNDPADKLNQSIKIMVVDFACRRAAQPHSSKTKQNITRCKNLKYENKQDLREANYDFTFFHPFRSFHHQLHCTALLPSTRNLIVIRVPWSPDCPPAFHEYGWKPTSSRCTDNVGPELVRCAHTSDSRSRRRLCRKGAVPRRGRLVAPRLL